MDQVAELEFGSYRRGGYRSCRGYVLGDGTNQRWRKDHRGHNHGTRQVK